MGSSWISISSSRCVRNNCCSEASIIFIMGRFLYDCQTKKAVYRLTSVSRGEEESDRELSENEKLAMRASPFAAGFFFPGDFFPATLRRPRNRDVSFFQREDYCLLRRPQLRSERQDFLHGSKPVRKLRVQGHTFQLIANTQPHQVVTRKLWTSHARGNSRA